MSVIQVSTASGKIPNIKPGVYPVYCNRVKDDVLANPQYGDGNVVKLYMLIEDLLDEEGEEIELDAMANRKVSPKAKLTRWAEALGRPIDFDSETEFDTAELVGRRCLAKVTREDANSWPKIDDLMALPESPSSSPTDISSWWKVTRDEGFERTAVEAKAQELYDNRLPKDLTPDERAHVLAALRKQ